MKKLTFIFDADDTLWENQALFNEFSQRWCAIAAGYGLCLDQAMSMLKRYDEQCYKQHRFGNIYYLGSMIRVFQELLTSGEAKKAEFEIRVVHDEIFLSPPVVYPGTSEALEELSDCADLFILTKGDPATQRRKIEQSGLEKWFNG
ncbi:MAG: HAD family hydrolase, partial [Candidatus Wallbacteria bacterium]|nr:HAD family hydrolase [Candidatus Wallbacteria bacterium]